MGLSRSKETFYARFAFESAAVGNLVRRKKNDPTFTGIERTGSQRIAECIKFLSAGGIGLFALKEHHPSADAI
jgi:hypothetical protein